MCLRCLSVFLKLGLVLTARVLGQFIPDSPILTIGEIWSETLAGTDVPPRLYSDVKGLQIQSQTFRTACRLIGATLIISKI